MTPEERQAVRERCEKATAGPWRWGPSDSERRREDPTGSADHLWADAESDVRVHSDGSAWAEYSPDIDVFGPDAAFIAAARTDLPRLLDEVERLESVLATPTWYEHEVERLKAARENALMIAKNYEKAPCFAALLGEQDDENPCTCPSCGHRAVIRALLTPSPERIG